MTLALRLAAPVTVEAPSAAKATPEDDLDFATAHYAAAAFTNAYGRLPDPVDNPKDRTVCHLLYEAMRSSASAVYTATGDMQEVERALAHLARRR